MSEKDRILDFVERNMPNLKVTSIRKFKDKYIVLYSGSNGEIIMPNYIGIDLAIKKPVYVNIWESNNNYEEIFKKED